MRSMFALALFLTGFSSLGHAVYVDGNYPWPYNMNYNYGIRPTPFGANAAADAATIRAKYESWKSAHVTTGAGCTGPGTGCYRANESTGAYAGHAFSEGISYGMLLAVYMGDQQYFDGFWRFKNGHNDGLGLLHWRVAPDNSISGTGSATDADEDIAYALYLAHYKWGSGGALNYKALADAEVAKIKIYDLDANRVRPGDQFNDCRYPSYFFPNQYVVFGKETNDAATWSAVAANCLTTINNGNNNTTGLIAEQINDSGGAGNCPIVNANNYAYNSARVPLRLAMHYVYYGTTVPIAGFPTGYQSPLNLLAAFFNGGSGGPASPSAVTDCYQLNGAGCGGFNAGAFYGPAGTSLMIGPAGTYATKLQAYYGHAMATPQPSYFDGAIALLSLLLMSGNMPNLADPSTIFTPTRTRTNTPYAGTPTLTPTVTPLAFAYIFEDFENTILVNTYRYAGGGTVGASLTVNAGIVSTQFQSGAYSDQVQVAVTSTAYYAGHGFDSSYAPASGIMNFTGATSVRVGIRVSAAMSVKVGFREGTINGGDDETWESPAQAIGTPNTWVYLVIPIASFTEGIYNPSCNPSSTTPSPCLTSGNNTFNIGSVKAFEIQFLPTITNATVWLDNIAFLPSVVPTMTPTKTPFPNPFTLIYDDFESPLSFQSAAPKRVTSYAHAAQGSTIAMALNTIPAPLGAGTGCINYNLGTAGVSYGGGGSFLSPYFTHGFVTTTGQILGNSLDATGAVSITMFINAPSKLQYRIVITEAGNTGVPQAGADGEVWNSALLEPGTPGTWEQVTVDINEFIEDPYNIVCNPATATYPNQQPAPGPCITGAQSGNNTMNLNRIYQVGIKLPGEQVGVASRSGSMCLDNVAFITSARTNTPTRTSTPGAPAFSATRTVTASPTRTPTPAANTFTPTPTWTRTNTLTATRTHTLTATASPTRTPTPAANTFTPTPTWTRTNTLTATRSITQTNTPLASTFTPTPTATRTHTLTATRTATLVNTLTSTPTHTRTHTQTATRTVTSTSTATRTHTQTHTPVPPASTMTATPTYSPIVSSTFTATRTATMTLTGSPTSSATRTVTRTITQTNTPVPPASTLTVTPTNSPIVANTFTVTLTASPTRTASVTLTGSPTSTGTRTVTQTNTPLPTLTATGSITQTNTPVPPASTLTVTPTHSPVVTNTYTTTLTASPTRTASVTLTGSPTATGSITQTNTPVPPLSTLTVTPTHSPVVTNTYTATLTASPTATPTVTPTVTLTATPTATLTATRTVTGTITQTDTPVPPASTLTSTRTNTPTATATYTATRTSTPTASPSGTVTVVVPVVSLVNPGSGSTLGGTLITVTGSNFLPGAEILIDGSPVATTWVSGSSLTASTSVHAPGTVNIEVRNPGNVLSSTSVPFVFLATTMTATRTSTPTVTATATPTVTLTATVTASPTLTITATGTPPAPVITGYVINGVAVTDGPPEGGYVLTIIGDNFSPVGAQVYFNGVSQTTSVSTTIVPGAISLVITAPVASANSTAVIEVRNFDGQISGPANFGIKGPTTPTPIPVPQSTDVIVDTRIAPNPNPTTQWVLLATAVEDVSVKVYTKGMVAVGETHSGPLDPNIGNPWKTIQMPSQLLTAPSGLYYVVVTATRSGKVYEAPKVGKCMVIR